MASAAQEGFDSAIESGIMQWKHLMRQVKVSTLHLVMDRHQKVIWDQDQTDQWDHHQKVIWDLDQMDQWDLLQKVTWDQDQTDQWDHLQETWDQDQMDQWDHT